MNLPTISLNFALSADGKISSVAKRPSGWTSREDHARLLELRKNADALMVGRGTLEADRMTMKSPQDPLRCVVSRSGNFDPGHPLFHTPGGPIHLLATEGQGIEIAGATLHRGSLADFLEELSRLGVRHLHCEGGGSLAFELLALDAVEEVHLTWAGHTLFGGREAPTISGVPGGFLPGSRKFELTEFDPRPEIGECFLSYRRVRE
ncbi:RibD family protein [Luteolibacter flavescens]|uniref:RibD family protein n=1 Tax=Luteolibacter flavescens TaxID=1859460 RepID=A0ABT3FWJ2_9BACT|nr:RibD family protein [Luteolibacter flavescens]MCW1887350.1 RibD family protein [Luteolibacter flavescens]